ncbi:MAG: hypothetical protein ABEH81_03990 [Halopenitus sp.]
MADRVLFQGKDDLGQTNLAEATAHSNSTDYVERDLTVNADHTAETIDITSGHAVIEDSQRAYDVFPDSRTDLNLATTSGKNYVYLTHDPNTQNDVSYAIESTQSPPSTPSLLIAVVDAANDTTTPKNRDPDASFGSANIEQVHTESREATHTVHKLDDGTIVADGQDGEIASGTDAGSVLQSVANDVTIGDVVEFHAETLDLNGTRVDFDQAVTLKAGNRRGTVIEQTDTATGCIKINGASASDVHQTTIKDIQFRGQGGTHDAIAVHLTNPDFVDFVRCQFRGLGASTAETVVIDDSSKTNFWGCVWNRHNDTCVRLGISGTSTADEVQFYGCRFDNPTDVLNAQQSDQVRFDGCKFRSLERAAFLENGVVVTFDGCNFEEVALNSQPAIEANSPSAHISVKDPLISVTSSSHYFIHATNVDQIVLEDVNLTGAVVDAWKGGNFLQLDSVETVVLRDIRLQHANANRIVNALNAGGELHIEDSELIGPEGNDWTIAVDAAANNFGGIYIRDSVIRGTSANGLGNDVLDMACDSSQTIDGLYVENCYFANLNANSIFDMAGVNGTLGTLRVRGCTSDGTEGSWFRKPAGSISNESIGENNGYTTANSGTATIGTSSTSVTVNHGLDETPNIEDIDVKWGEDPTAVGVDDIWVSNIGSSSFDINVDAQPSASLTVGWDAKTPSAT